jgi:hypothetical protein
MKPRILPGTAHCCLLATPHRVGGLVVFWALAFLPSVSHLLGLDWTGARLFAGLGPLSAGIWLAGAICQTRLAFTVLGALLSALVWLLNWLMLAGSTCCSFN